MVNPESLFTFKINCHHAPDMLQLSYSSGRSQGVSLERFTNFLDPMMFTLDWFPIQIPKHVTTGSHQWSFCVSTQGR